MSVTGGGRQIGTWLPAGAMKHVDTGAIRTEMYRRRMPAMLIGFLYIAGMILFGTIGAVIGGQMTGGGQGLVYFGIGFVILYVVGIALLSRLRERLC